MTAGASLAYNWQMSHPQPDAVPSRLAQVINAVWPFLTSPYTVVVIALLAVLASYVWFNRPTTRRRK